MAYKIIKTVTEPVRSVLNHFQQTILASISWAFISILFLLVLTTGTTNATYSDKPTKLQTLSKDLPKPIQDIIRNWDSVSVKIDKKINNLK
jgi:hypothetical protein